MKWCKPITTAVNMERFMTICCSIMGFTIALVWSAFLKFCARDATCTIVAIQTLDAVSFRKTKSKGPKHSQESCAQQHNDFNLRLRLC